VNSFVGKHNEITSRYALHFVLIDKLLTNKHFYGLFVGIRQELTSDEN